MQVVVDPHAGPCPGVKRALRMAEQQLQKGDCLVAVGPIIHNRREMERLENMGLSTVNQNDVETGNTDSVEQKTVFVRSHGISGSLLQSLEETRATVVNGTCPVVQKIQHMISDYHKAGFQIIIVGKPGHPEVSGLNGHCDNQAVIIQTKEDLSQVDFQKPSVLLSQTTMSQSLFFAIRDILLEKNPDLIVKDTTCRQVNRRHENIRNFAHSVDVVLLIGGKNSSNTRVLYDISREINPRTFWIEEKNDILPNWFSRDDTVGVTGSASTPVWQLQDIQEFLLHQFKHSAA